jgi:hypothetical protein
MVTDKNTTSNQIFQWAREAGYDDAMTDLHAPALKRFANLVAAAEREECAKECDKLGDEFHDATPAHCAFVIRERGAP